MLYKKIRVSFIHAKKQLYRIFLVDPQMNLTAFGCTIISAFHGEFEHLFQFSEKGRNYVLDSAMENSWYDSDVPMGDYEVADLAGQFTFVYDFGDNWEFECRSFKRMVEVNEKFEAKIIEGAGTGIWEDNIGTFYDYLGGEVNPDMQEDDDENGLYMPYNIHLEKISDQDKPLDLEEENASLIGYAKHGYQMIISMGMTNEPRGNNNRIDAVWTPFLDEFDEINLMDEEENIDPDQILNLFHLFQDIVNDGDYPSDFEEFIQEDGIPVMDITALISILCNVNIMGQRAPETYEALTALQHLFVFEDYLKDGIRRGIIECMIEMDQDEKADKEIKAWQKEDPSNLQGKSCLYLYMEHIGRHEEVVKQLKKEPELKKEVDGKNLIFFNTACELLENDQKEQKLAKKIEKKVFNHLLQTAFDLFGGEDFPELK